MDWGGSWAVLSALEAAVGGAGGSVDGSEAPLGVGVGHCTGAVWWMQARK